MNDAQLNGYLDTATELAYKAGEVMRTNFVATMEKEWKADETPVTASDIAINHLVTDAISIKYPDHIVHGEESGGQQNAGEYIWVCDPVDGTFPFSHGIPTSTFSLALVKDGQPIVGTLYDPFMDRLYTAKQGRGAYMNGLRINVLEKPDDRPLIGIDWWAANGTDLLDVVRRVQDSSFTVMTLLSGAYMGSLVAAGKLTAVVSATDKAYDIAAQKIIIEEAGGVTSNLEGGQDRADGKVNGFIAGPADIHEKLLSIVKEVKK